MPITTSFIRSIRVRSCSFFTLIFLFISSITFAHWTSRGPYGGTVTCFAAADTNLFLGTAAGGIFVSTNKQATVWKYVNYTGLTSGKINTLMAFGRRLITGSADSGIFISKDKGVSWLASNTGLVNKNVSGLISSGAIVFAGTHGGGVFLSADSGATWQAVNNGLVNKDVTALLAVGSTVYAGTSAGVFVTGDNGTSWNAVNTGLSSLTITSLAVSGGTILAGTGSGVFFSPVSAISWVVANNGLNNSLVKNIYVKGGKLYAATIKGVYVSPDDNINWTAANTGLPADSVNTVIDFNGKLFAGTANSGIYASSNVSVSWSENNNGLSNLTTSALYCSGSLVVTATNRGVFVCRNFPLSTFYITANRGLTDSLHVSSLVFVNSLLYAGTLNSGVYVSADTGKTWATANTGLTNLKVKHLLVTNTRIFAATTDGFVFSTDKNTINWQQTNIGIPASPADITAFATDGVNAFIGINGNGVYKNADGINWIAFNNGLTSQQVTSLAILGDNIFAGTRAAGVFTSSITTPAWTQVNTGLPTLAILSLGVTGKYVIAGYKSGIYATYNNGKTWLAPNIKLYTPEYADAITIAFTELRVFIGTPANSLYSNAKAELPVIPPSDINELNDNEGTLTILPNPSNGNFRINWSTVSGNIKEIGLYDISGRLLKYFDKAEPAYFVSYPAGVYLVRVATSFGTYTKKLVLY